MPRVLAWDRRVDYTVTGNTSAVACRNEKAGGAAREMRKAHSQEWLRHLGWSRRGKEKRRQCDCTAFTALANCLHGPYRACEFRRTPQGPGLAPVPIGLGTRPPRRARRIVGWSTEVGRYKGRTRDCAPQGRESRRAQALPADGPEDQEPGSSPASTGEGGGNLRIRQGLVLGFGRTRLTGKRGGSCPVVG